MSAQRFLLTALLVLALLTPGAAASLEQPVTSQTPLAPAHVPAVPGDEYWAAGFHLPGMNDAVSVLAVGLDGSLYAGGHFTAAGGVAANHIARWDGAQWHSLSSGMDGYSVYALEFGPDGSLYAGGVFTTAGGVDANYIARWDGSEWHPLGSGMDYWVYALVVGPDGSLYAGGNFTTAGGVIANGIARWDGSEWHPLGGGMGGPNYYPVIYALAFGPDGSLYAGGYFTTAGGVAANKIARWDGSQWRPLGSGMGGDVDYPAVLALAFGSDGLLYAGGGFTTAGGVDANYIARWDSSEWHPLYGMHAAVYDLAFGPDGSLYAGNDFGTARWNGTHWHSLGSVAGGGAYPPDPDVSAVVFGPDGSLYAGGDFTTVGGVEANHIARWNGSEWHPLQGSGMNDVVRALALGPDGSLYAGGCFTAAGGAQANLIARWDGTQWHPLGSGIGGYVVYALAFGPDGSLYAGGGIDSAGGVAARYIARWDGTQWHPLSSVTNGSVSALAVGPDGSLYAGGAFTTAGGVVANHIARWDGSQWHPLGSGMDGGVLALAFGPDGYLHAGGCFTTAGAIAANRIARWDGSQWHPLGSGTGGGGARAPHVLALAFGRDGSLYAGGLFTTAGGIAASHIARWDGSQWHPLGSGMGGGTYPLVRALAFGPDGSLYTGGDFTAAGDKPSSYIAQWTGSVPEWYYLPLILRR